MQRSSIFIVFLLLFLVQCKTGQIEKKIDDKMTTSTAGNSPIDDKSSSEQNRIENIKSLCLTLSSQLQTQNNSSPESQDLAKIANAIAELPNAELKNYLDSGFLQIVEKQLEEQKAKSQGLQLVEQNKNDPKEESSFFKDNQVQISGLFLFSMGLINVSLGLGRFKMLQTPSYAAIIFGMTRIVLSMPLISDPKGAHDKESTIAKNLGLAGATFGIINGVLDLAQAGLSALVKKNVSNVKFMSFVEKYSEVLPTEFSAANLSKLPKDIMVQSKSSPMGIIETIKTSSDPKKAFMEFEKKTIARADLCRSLGQDLTADTIEHMLEQRRRMYVENFDAKGVLRPKAVPLSPEINMQAMRANYGFEAPKSGIKSKLIWSVLNVGTGLFGIISAQTVFKLADNSQAPQTPQETLVQLNQVLEDYAKNKTTPSVEQTLLQ